jgi:hypothetical protein
MAISIFDLIKIGVGPSSSHTMGPMLAARQFLLEAREAGVRSDRAGRRAAVRLAGADRQGTLHRPGHPAGPGGRGAKDARAGHRRGAARTHSRRGAPQLLGEREIAFDEPMDLLFHTEQMLPRHSNGMRFTAFDGAGETLLPATLLLHRRRLHRARRRAGCGDEADEVAVPFPFDNAAELLEQCRRHGLSIHELVLANESAWRPRTDARAAARTVAGHEGLRAPGVRGRGRAARRAEGAAPRAAALPRAVRRGCGGRLHGLGECLRAGRQRGECRRRTHRHRSHQRRGGHHPGGAALLPALRQRRGRGGHPPLPADRRRDRDPVQEERLHLRRGDGLPGRGGRGLFDGGRRPRGGDGRQQRPGRERRRDRHGAQPRP